VDSGGASVAELEAVTQNEENNYDPEAGKGLCSVLQCPVNGFICIFSCFFFIWLVILHFVCHEWINLSVTAYRKRK